MSGFITRAACHGRRPSSFAGNVARERSGLITRLLKERGVARFVVAPDGYGKTSLAVEYAETIFSWAHVFWVNAKSPCFIRDLDSRCISSACLAHDSEASLVVFDDLPALEVARMQAFSEEIDVLIAAHCEVLVTCVPTCDMVGSMQPDRIRIGALDLLLDDVELDSERSSEERVRRPAAQVGAAGRIPAVAWASDEAALSAFVRSVLNEEMPSDLLFAVTSTLVLQSGSYSDLLAAGPCDRGMLAELIGDYPHLGFDAEIDCFEAPGLDVSVLAVPVKHRLSELVARSSFDTSEQLVYAWADVLVEAGNAGRACDLIREVCPRRMRASWLAGHAYDLISQASFLPTLRLARDQDSSKGETRVRLNAIEALCRMVLGDEDGAIRCAKRHAFDATVPVEVRVCDLLISARLGKGPLFDKANEALAREASAASGPGRDANLDWAFLARAWCAGVEGPLELAGLLCDCLDDDARERELCIGVSWLYGLLEGNQDAVSMSVEIRNCERFVRDHIQPVEGRALDFFAVSAGLSFEEARNRGVRGDSGMLEASVLIQLRQAEMGVLAQRRQFEEDVRSALARRDDWGGASSASRRFEEGLPARPKRSVPILSVHLFGHFEASLGDIPLDPKRFSRRNARTLLVLLAMNHGRDLSREAVERAMWPQSSHEVAHKNYYSVWSNLKRALTLPDGTCPYLVRHQYGCRLDSRYAQSDVERFSEICREFLFGVPDIDKWAALFAEIDRDFSSDLMPAERKNRLIIEARNEYRMRLVDSLVAATFSVIDIDSPQWGIWFARAALAHDETREDAYIALMRAQIASNQRTAAMMTYLKCRRVLSDQLGIDPSPEITALYESLLDAQ